MKEKLTEQYLSPECMVLVVKMRQGVLTGSPTGSVPELEEETLGW